MNASGTLARTIASGPRHEHAAQWFGQSGFRLRPGAGSLREARVLLLLSRPVQAEYRRVLGSPAMVRRNPEITREAVELVLRRLRYIGEYLGHVGVSFRFDRDRDDEPFIELAIAGAASHVVTGDNDLLSLTAGHDDASRRFRQRLPGIHVLRPAAFLRELESRGARRR